MVQRPTKFRIVKTFYCVLPQHYSTISQTLQHSGGEALQPLTISQDGIVSISQVSPLGHTRQKHWCQVHCPYSLSHQEHVATPDALARLFVPQVAATVDDFAFF